jgi:hypothetical protein
MFVIKRLLTETSTLTSRLELAGGMFQENFEKIVVIKIE